MPWTHLREPFLRGMLTDWTSELTLLTQQFVLSRVKLPALLLSAILPRRFCCPCEPLVKLLLEWGHAEQPETFFCLRSSFPHHCMTSDPDGNRHVRFLQVWYSLASGEVKHIVHLIRLKLNSCLLPLLPMWLDRLQPRLRESRTNF